MSNCNCNINLPIIYIGQNKDVFFILKDTNNEPIDTNLITIDEAQLYYYKYIYDTIPGTNIISQQTLDINNNIINKGVYKLNIPTTISEKFIPGILKLYIKYFYNTSPGYILYNHIILGQVKKIYL